MQRNLICRYNYHNKSTLGSQALISITNNEYASHD